MTQIDREQLKHMMDEDVVVTVEVLDAQYFKKFHLPGAINIPISEDFESHVQNAVPDRTTPIVVYCMDEDCPASPEAAQKLEEMGYQRVYDYQAGKMDWKEAGLPVEN